MRSLSLTLSWVIVPCLQCLFLRLRKYLVFFSPSLYHWDLDLKIAPFVRYSIIAYNSRFFVSSSDDTFCLCVSLPLNSERHFSRAAIACSISSFFVSFFFLEVLYFTDFSLTFILTISHSKLGFTVSSCTYSTLVWFIIILSN